MLARAAAIPHVTGVELVGNWDIVEASAAVEGNATRMKGALADHGLGCVSIIPDLFVDKIFGRDSFFALDAAVRTRAVEYTLRMADIARLLGCGLLDIWPGQDDYDYLLWADYNTERGYLRDCIAEVAARCPDIRFALEYKPKEPRTHSYIAWMADTLLLCAETGLPNVGVTIDTGHAFVAGESVGEAIVLAKRAGDRLFHTHFNDNHGTWDDDMIVGTVHSTTYLESLYWLRRTGYDGWLSTDQYPYREDAAGAIGGSIAWLRGYGRIVDERYPEITALLTQNDPVAVSRFLRSALMPGFHEHSEENL